MSLLGYQQALCDLVASPQLCLEARADSDRALSRYELTARERRRLAAVVRQPGMSTSCTLHRVNRITPIHDYLSLTCLLLGDRLIGEVETFWSQGKPSDLQFGLESERFGQFLRRRLRAGEVHDPYLEEILAFELAANELRALSRGHAFPAGERLVRVVEFRHEPLPLLDALSRGQRPESEPQQGRYFVELDFDGDGLELRDVTVDAAPGLSARH